MLKIALIVGTLILVTPAVAGDHLVPTPSPYSRLRDASEARDDDVLTHFYRDAYDRDVAVRMFARMNPGWTHAVAVLVHDGRYAVRELHDEIRPGAKLPRILGHPSLATMNRYFRVVRTECELVPALGARVVAAWRSAIFRTRYDRPAGDPLIVHGDGDSYDFATMGPSGWISGETWSPDPGGEAGLLVATADLLSRLCREPDAAAQLERKLTSLEEAVRQ